RDRRPRAALLVGGRPGPSPPDLDAPPLRQRAAGERVRGAGVPGRHVRVAPQAFPPHEAGLGRPGVPVLRHPQAPPPTVGGGPAFWRALPFTTAAAVLIALASPLAAAAYGDQRIIPLLIVGAVAMPAGTPAAILRARARLDMRFGLLSRVQIGVAAIRNLGAV